ncbi:ubiquitin domain-containing protein DSK2b-like protein isoform X1 [Tanacetum coccineum]
MGGDGDVTDGVESNGGGGDSVTINVWTSNGTKFTVQVSLGSSVETFKTILEEKCDIPAAQQCLIYKGRILIDDQTLKSYGWRKKLEAAYPEDGEERTIE